jgi:hypothetical protein
MRKSLSVFFWVSSASLSPPQARLFMDPLPYGNYPIFWGLTAGPCVVSSAASSRVLLTSIAEATPGRQGHRITGLERLEQSSAFSIRGRPAPGRRTNTTSLRASRRHGVRCGTRESSSETSP